MKFRANLKETYLLLILAGIQFTHILDFMIIMPLGPQLMRVLTIDPQQFSLIVSVYTFSAGISSFFSALFVDKVDRKVYLLYSYIGFILGTVLCGLAPNYEYLLAARVIAGAFGGLINGSLFSIIGDLVPYERRGKATGLVMSAFSLASVAGVPIGLYLSTLMDWRLPFFSLGGLSFLILLFSAFYLPPIKGHIKTHVSHPIKTVLAIFRNVNHLWSFSLIISMVFAGFSVIPYIAPYMVFNVGLTESELSYIYLVGGGSTLISARIIGVMSDKYGSAKVFITVATLSVVPIYIVTNIQRVEMWVALCVSALFFVLVSGRFVPGMTLIMSSVYPESRGGFLSINSSLQQVGSGFAALLSGFIIQKNASGQLENYNIVGYIAIGCTLSAILVSTKLKRIS
jgi:predicted MFS family arabinose efflux permease